MFRKKKEKTSDVVFQKSSRILEWKYKGKHNELETDEEFMYLYVSDWEQIIVAERGPNNSFLTSVYAFDLDGEEIRMRQVPGRLYELYEKEDGSIILTIHIDVKKQMEMYEIKKYGKIQEL